MLPHSNRRAGLASKVKTLADGGRLPGSSSASSGWRFFIAAYFLVLSASLNAQIYRSLNFEDVRISDYLEGKPDNGFWNLTDAGTDYKVATKWGVSTGIVRPPEVSGKFSREGKQSLKITIEPNTSRKTPGEKCFIDVCHGDLDEFATRNETRAVAFSILIPDEYELQGQPLMLTEWWNGKPWVTLSITPGSLKLHLHVKNKDKSKTIPLNQLERNRWHDIILEVTPNAKANGSVRYWCDGELVKSVDDMPIGDGAKRKYFIEVGLYRPACPQRAVAYFDSIHLGRTGEELKNVAPSPLKITQVATPRLETTEAVAASVAAVPSARKPNILFIAVDDLNSWVHAQPGQVAQREHRVHPCAVCLAKLSSVARGGDDRAQPGGNGHYSQSQAHQHAQPLLATGPDARPRRHPTGIPPPGGLSGEGQRKGVPRHAVRKRARERSGGLG